ncbi:MAG TPA: hydrogenase maturation nickel metallochaperone HypA [Vicinamibacterales bacterium]|nr:hydrogenase maturation nickel metallochaperone HypA [Vicinamibacterales bacterium]
MPGPSTAIGRQAVNVPARERHRAHQHRTADAHDRQTFTPWMFRMHELSVAVSLVETICEELPKLGLVRVATVNLRVGALSGVAPDALTFAFDIAIDNTQLAGAQLHIERTDGRELALASLEVFDAAEDRRGS